MQLIAPICSCKIKLKLRLKLNILEFYENIAWNDLDHGFYDAFLAEAWIQEEKKKVEFPTALQVTKIVKTHKTKQMMEKEHIISGAFPRCSS